ncbi:hypothetical protein B0A52_07463 [Exophiala mesophila]|uniref:Acyltransferase 3 domain-containing protein n=1 Tax=Exophiala mesophila TaxID=212818 RepID=A0A438MZC8_EXOME|nr:hypothetical protein B0A52_07463 [Exophiala mesophila]
MRSFLEPRLAIATLWSENPASKELSSTAWMNGLRGWAAFSVFNFHYLFAFTDIVSVGYGYDRDHRQIFALPPFRLLYDGGTCVNIFFVISGYVCSSQTLKLVSSKRMPDLGKTLSTSLFRRWFRLYLPCMCMMLITALMTHFGLFGFTDGMMAEREKFFPGPLAEDNLTRFGSLRQQLVFFATEVHQLVDIWNVKPVYAKHDPHLWTIPYEYRASIHLYLTILALAQCHCFVRLGGFVALSALHLSLGRWEMPLFLLGAAIAQYRIICDNPSSLLPNSRQSEQMPSNAAQNGENRSLLRERVSKLVRLLAFAVALYLMTYPIAGYKRPAPGYIWINNYIPRWYKRKEKLPKSIGVLMFFADSHNTWVKLCLACIWCMDLSFTPLDMQFPTGFGGLLATIR